MKLRRVLGGIGRGMIGAGTLILLFVAYQLWGTGIRTAQAQNDLENEFEQQAEQFVADNADVDVKEPDPTSAVIPPPPVVGDQVARIEIPEIGVNEIFLQGVDLDTLKDGPGHWPSTPLPGEVGNAAIAGHRTTYGAPFHNLDELGAGDRIIITYYTGARFVYEYRETEIVSPDQVEILDNSEDSRLTLMACHPKYSAAERIVVRSALVGVPRPAQPIDPEVVEDASALEFDSLDSNDSSRTPAVLWGLAAAAVFAAVWALGHFWRRLPAYLVGLPAFLVVLFIFFENFSRLLPAAY